MPNPTRFPAGLATSSLTEPLGNYPLPDPFHTGSIPAFGVASYVTDFTGAGTADYTVTGASSAVAIAASAVGGAMTVTPGGATTATVAYKTGSALKFIPGQRLWYTSRLQASGVGADSFYFGLQAGSSANDGLWFSKAASSQSINVVSTIGGVATTLATGITTVAAATYFDCSFYYDGTNLNVFVGPNLVARVTSPTLTTAVLTPVFQITPAATETLTVDFVLAAQEIAR